MIDRQKLESVLSRRFPGATSQQIAAAANAIMGLEDEWEEVVASDGFACNFSSRCVDIFGPAREADAGTKFRLLRRRSE